MRSSPAVMSSSPAMSRRRVDFPQPDGPTKTTNSPSSIRRSTPRITFAAPKDLLTSLKTTSAMEPSPLDGAAGQARHDLPLKNQNKSDHRDRYDDRGRHDGAPRQLVRGTPAHESNRDRHGATLVAERERQRKEKLVPRNDEGQKPGGDRCGSHQWQEHAPDRYPRRGAVNQRRLFDLAWKLAHEGGEHPYRERQGEHQVRQGESGKRVVEPERPDQFEHSRQHRDLREHRDGQDRKQEYAPAAKGDPPERIG